MAAAASGMLSQVSCFSAMNHKLPLQLQRRSFLLTSPRPQSWVVMSLEGRDTDAFGSDIKSTLSYTASESKPNLEQPTRKCPVAGEHAAEEKETGDSAKVYGTAKIHDFCFGIPYGGLVLSGGLLGFIFSRNPTTLSSGVLFGSALLALSTLSLKIWRQGGSSLPFILGQFVLSAMLFWRNFQAWILTKKLIPTGFNAVISFTMACFFSYVMISGGNPPPKKLQSSTTL